MKAQTLTPFELFGNQVRYVVPLFQRPYVWNRTDQWEPLWDDVRTVADRLLEGFEDAVGLFDRSPGHFLGAIVLDQQLVPAAFIQMRNIVDGQQRLTTLQLLLDAIAEIARDHGNAADAAALTALVLNDVRVAQNEDDVFKVWPTNYDRAAFRTVMHDHLVPTGEAAKSQIAAAHAFFKQEATEWCDLTGDPEKVKGRIHALALTLTQYLKLVVIDLESGDNAQVIFETLNHRGTPLLAADLVKNLVFQVADLQGSDVETIYETSWKRFDSNDWRRKISQGRLYRPRVDVFLNYWLVMRTTHEVPADRIFADFRNYLRLADQPVTSTIEDLARSARVFDSIESFPWTSIEGTFAYRVLNVVQQWVWGPLLLWLYGFPDSDLPNDQRWRALKAVESWAVRRMLRRASTKSISQLVIDLLRRVQAVGPATAGDETIEFLSTQTSESTYWPTDEQVLHAAQSLPFYGSLSQGRVRMVLEALEDDLRTAFTEQEHCVRGRLTIEHVMPQGWREHWALPNDGHPEVLTTNRDGTLHKLGNLTLVTNRLNPALSNRPWTNDQARARGLGDKGKRSILNEHSVLMLNKRIIDDWPLTWSEEAIAERGHKLGEQVLRIWPGPNALGSGQIVQTGSPAV